MTRRDLDWKQLDSQESFAPVLFFDIILASFFFLTPTHLSLCLSLSLSLSLPWRLMVQLTSLGVRSCSVERKRQEKQGG